MLLMYSGDADVVADATTVTVAETVVETNDASKVRNSNSVF